KKKEQTYCFWTIKSHEKETSNGQKEVRGDGGSKPPSPLTTLDLLDCGGSRRYAPAYGAGQSS
ncbi:MAG: hypothetical protein PHU83_08415, partial [Eubacteriales bacterium]|nr:hypothetical protein [Eubacteriales bacterium]